MFVNPYIKNSKPEFHRFISLGESNLPLNYIFNSICQLVAKCTNATGASLMLYIGKTNSLSLAGNYLNTSLLPHIEDEPVKLTPIYGKVLEDINFYEYLKYVKKLEKKIDLSNLTEKDLKDFTTFCQCQSLNPDVTSLEDFIKKMQFATTNQEKYALYWSVLLRNKYPFPENINEPVSQEHVETNGERYYKKCLDLVRAKNFELPPHISSYDHTEAPYKRSFTELLLGRKYIYNTKTKLFEQELKASNTTIAAEFTYDKLIYFPLVFWGRLFGLLRLNVHEKFNDDNIVSPLTIIESEDFYKLIIQSIASYIGKQYNLTKYKQLNIEGIISNSFKQNGKSTHSKEWNKIEHTVSYENRRLVERRKKAKSLCKALNEMINSRGCILRLFKDQQKNNFKIVGYSENLEKYLKAYRTKNFLITHSGTLSKILSIEDTTRVVGLKINIEQTLHDSKVKEYTCYYKGTTEAIQSTHKLSELTGKNMLDTDIDSLFGEKTTEILNFYSSYGFTEILYFPIFSKQEEIGYLTFANTAYRFFHEEDINTLYPVIQRIDIALLNSAINIRQMNDLFLAHLQHDLIQPLERLDIMVNREPSAEHYDMLRTVGAQTTRIALYHLYQMKHFGINATLYGAEEPIGEYLKLILPKLKSVLEYSEYIRNQTNSKPREVVLKLNNELPDNYKFKNMPILETVIWHFATNARKYSFSNINLPPASYKGNYNPARKLFIEIDVRAFLDNYVKISVSNYGYDFNISEKIWEKDYRSKDAQKVAYGLGNGLYICSLLLNQIEADYTAYHDRDIFKTTFEIIIEADK